MKHHFLCNGHLSFKALRQMKNKKSILRKANIDSYAGNLLGVTSGVLSGRIASSRLESTGGNYHLNQTTVRKSGGFSIIERK